MSKLQGFWSYVHRDDDAERGRIIQLAQDIVQEFQMVTGEDIELFYDKAGIKWGEIWKEKVDGNLASVGFFIPVITPRYFMSPECRRELQSFASRAARLGVQDLILPLHYVNVPALADQNSQDDAVKLVNTFQWFDWRDLRHSELTSEKYRRGVAEIASRLAQANRRAEEAALVIPILGEGGLTRKLGDQPDPIDILDNRVKLLEKLKRLVNEQEAAFVSIGTVLTQATDDFKKENISEKPLAVFQHWARELEPKLLSPVVMSHMLSRAIYNETNLVDLWLHAVFDNLSEFIDTRPNARQNACELIHDVQQLVASFKKSFPEMKETMENLDYLQTASRELRPVTRQLNEALTLRIELDPMLDEWLALIEASGLQCDEVVAVPTE